MAMHIQNQLIVNLLLSSGEAYVLLRTTLSNTSFQRVFISAFALNFALLAVWSVFIWPFVFSPLRNLPLAPGRFNDIKVLFDSPRGKSPLKWMRTIPNDGLIHFRSSVNRSFLLATNHQALLDVMNTNTYDFEKPWMVRNFLARIIGFGLILSEGGMHKKQRKTLTPAFNVKNIRALYPLMWEKTGILLSQLENEIKENPSGSGQTGNLELGVWASRLTLDIIGPAAMGRDFQSLTHSENKVAESFLAILEPTKEKIAFVAVNFALPQWLVQRLPWKLNKVVDTEVGFLRGLCHQTVRDKRTALQQKKANEEELEADILGFMMHGSDFTDSELVDQMLTFLAAGHETTASALTWCCYQLCQNPDIQTRLRQEIRERIPSADHPITWSDLESMPLLHGVCEEVLRLYPTVPATVRESIRDTVVAGHPVPQGTRILLVPYAINRSPEFWGTTGDQYLPERWIDTDEAGRKTCNRNGGASSNYAQITFLHGQRACIGKDFARAELRCAVAGVVGRFAFELQDPHKEIEIAGAVTTKPVGGMNLKMTRVEGW